MDIRTNNLDSLRLLLALFVVFEHTNNLFHVALSDSHRFGAFIFNLSNLAVSTFFIISGMLTYISYQRDPDMVRFYLRRFFRVFPAYWAIILLQIIVFLVIAPGVVIWQELPGYALVNVLTANFLDPSFIDGIPALNGSLWTIKIEASYYAVLPLIIAALMRVHWLTLIMIGSLIWAIAFPNETLARQLPGKLYLFGLGIVLAWVLPKITPRLSLIALLCVPPTMALMFSVEGYEVVEELCVALSGVCLILAFMRQWIRTEALDISYTLYLVHYPLLVIVTRFLLPGEPFWIILSVGVALSIICAIALSYLIERPALRLGRRVVQSRSQTAVMSSLQK